MFIQIGGGGGGHHEASQQISYSTGISPRSSKDNLRVSSEDLF